MIYKLIKPQYIEYMKDFKDYKKERENLKLYINTDESEAREYATENGIKMPYS